VNLFPRMASGRIIETQVPARLDRLPWSRWHVLVVAALGVTWILDGLEVTLAGSLGAILKDPATLGLSDTQVGASATAYLLGAVVGALGFGHGTDLWGRKRLFYVTLGVYLAGTALSGCAWNFWSYFVFRFITGAGIGGEYAAINSAIDELIPARFRGRIDLGVNSSFWIGSALGSGAVYGLLDPRFVPLRLGWRLAFGVGAAIGLGILCLRRFVPESPRWLVLHGKEDEAIRVVDGVEAAVSRHAGPLPAVTSPPLRLRVRARTPWREIWHAMVYEHRRRSFLGLALMGAQAFFYNAIFFTAALVLTKFYQVAPGAVALYLLPFALANALGPILLGHFFDTVGRKPMIVLTYGLSGLLLAATAVLFRAGLLTPATQTLCWSVTFFVASSAASSAYLTVSEIFPLEIRALAIAIFFAAGTLVGGAAAPLLFGWIVGTGSIAALFWGYLAAAALMAGAAGVEAWLGVKAEGQPLEKIAPPLAAE
jgi:MFS family permease